MAKQNRNIVISIVLIVQTVVAISLGLFVLYLFKKDYIPPNVYMGSVSVGNKTRAEALRLIEERYAGTVDSGELVIKFSDDQDYIIKYSDLDAVLDLDKSLDKARGNSKKGFILNMIKNYFSTSDLVIYPEVMCNEELLAEKIEELALLVHKPAKNAQISLENEKVVSKSGENGVELNTENTFNRVKNDFGRSLDSPIKLNSGYNGEIIITEPNETLDELQGLDTVIAFHSTEIKQLWIEEYAIEAAAAIDSFTIYPKDYLKTDDSKVFSFNKCLADSGIDIDKSNDGYNLVASTLYAVILKTGIKMDFIKRNKSQNSVDYIIPGLDAKVDGKTRDLVFENTLTYPIKIFTEMKGKTLNVRVVGKKENNSNEVEIGYSIIQKYSPSIVTTVNYDLKPGEEKWLSIGKEGLEVEVYRNTKTNGENIKEFLYIDKYEAVDAILQTSPKNKADEGIIK